MTKTITLKEAPHELRVQRKRQNLELAEKNQREQQCFWTWPFGHVSRAFKTEPTKMMVNVGEEYVRILIFQCEVCGHERREAVDESGRVRTELRKRIWQMNIPLPE